MCSNITGMQAHSWAAMSNFGCLSGSARQACSRRLEIFDGYCEQQRQQSDYLGVHGYEMRRLPEKRGGHCCKFFSKIDFGCTERSNFAPYTLLTAT
jgi:hypothetical protein